MPQESKYDNIKKHVKPLLIEIIGVLLSIIGIILLCLSSETKGYAVVENYTESCMNFNELTTKCKDSIKTPGNVCTCYIAINITKPMEAPVTAFYELESYDQISSSSSRDDEQLSGHLSLTPSKSCGTYTYAETTEGKKPIAPCGALADAMFNDTFSLQINNDFIPTIQTGLISEDDKAPYRNPTGNLKEAFKQFSKPINWVRNVWELDTTNAENNGFQNEAFIAWMKTDWKQKPVWRFNHTAKGYEHGVPAGRYILRVEYAYPPSRYDGPRKFIISSIREITHLVKLWIGIILLVIGLLLMIGAGVMLWLKIRNGERKGLRSNFSPPY